MNKDMNKDMNKNWRVHFHIFTKGSDRPTIMIYTATEFWSAVYVYGMDGYPVIDGRVT